MTLAIRSTHNQLPEHLQCALSDGYLTTEQVRELIAFQANRLDLSVAEAIQCAHNDSLPQTTVGADLKLLISLLAD